MSGKFFILIKVVFEERISYKYLVEEFSGYPLNILIQITLYFGFRNKLKTIIYFKQKL